MMFNRRRLKMKRSTFSAFFVVAAIAGSLGIARGQMISATAQNTASRAAPPTVPKPVATARMPQHVGRASNLGPQRANPLLPRAAGQPAAYLQRTSPPIVRNSNYSVAALNPQRRGAAQQTATVDPAIRQTELRTLAAMHQRRGIVTREGTIVDPTVRQHEAQTLEAVSGHSVSTPVRELIESDPTMRDRQAFANGNQTVAAMNPQSYSIEDTQGPARQREKVEPQKDGHGKKLHNKKDRIGFDEAFRRHWHEWHDRNWWHNHCDTIVFVPIGYYFMDGSYWYPAYGYDPLQTYYDYDGPIYTYSNLLPDEVIANVQTALQDAGYYYGPITGSLSVDTRAAIANFQRDAGLAITGAIDEDTVAALGLY